MLTIFNAAIIQVSNDHHMLPNQKNMLLRRVQPFDATLGDQCIFFDMNGNLRAIPLGSGEKYSVLQRYDAVWSHDVFGSLGKDLE